MQSFKPIGKVKKDVNYIHFFLQCPLLHISSRVWLYLDRRESDPTRGSYTQRPMCSPALPLAGEPSAFQLLLSGISKKTKKRTHFEINSLCLRKVPVGFWFIVPETHRSGLCYNICHEGVFFVWYHGSFLLFLLCDPAWWGRWVVYHFVVTNAEVFLPPEDTWGMQVMEHIRIRQLSLPSLPFTMFCSVANVVSTR